MVSNFDTPFIRFRNFTSSMSQLMSLWTWLKWLLDSWKWSTFPWQWTSKKIPISCRNLWLASSHYSSSRTNPASLSHSPLLGFWVLISTDSMALMPPKRPWWINGLISLHNKYSLKPINWYNKWQDSRKVKLNNSQRAWVHSSKTSQFSKSTLSYETTSLVTNWL